MRAEELEMGSGKTIKQIRVGDRAAYSRVVTQDEVERFAEISGDKNPVHLDEEYARTTTFGGRIAHGMLAASYISTVLGMELPGPGAIYLGQTLRFCAPVRPGDRITATVSVAERIVEKNRLQLDCAVTNQDGVVVIEGQATVLPPKE